MKFSDLHDPAAASELLNRFKKLYNTKVCLYPRNDCKGKIISAHTLSTESMLRPISKDGMVYALKPNIPSSPGERSMQLALRGLRDVSVFNGFCSKHDKILFSSIEDDEIVCSPQQLFTFAYRAIAKEVYLKRKQLEAIPTLAEIKKIHGFSEDLQYSTDALLYQKGILQGIEDIERLKSRLDSHLINAEFGRVVTTVFEFELPPPLSASFVYAPDFDFDGNHLQHLEDFESDLSHLMVTLLPTSRGGLLLLSHEDTANNAPTQLINTLKQQEDISSSVIWLIACQTENFAISPGWFDSLSYEDRTLFVDGFFANVNFNASDNNLKNRLISVTDWKLKHTFTI